MAELAGHAVERLEDEAARGASAVLSVEDRGIGIAEDEQGVIFRVELPKAS